MSELIDLQNGETLTATITEDPAVQPNTKWLCKSSDNENFYFRISGPDLKVKFMLWKRVYPSAAESDCGKRVCNTKKTASSYQTNPIRLSDIISSEQWLIIPISGDTDIFRALVVNSGGSVDEVELLLHQMQSESWNHNQCEQVHAIKKIELKNGEMVYSQIMDMMPEDEVYQSDTHRLCKFGDQVSYRVSGPNLQIKRLKWKSTTVKSDEYGNECHARLCTYQETADHYNRQPINLNLLEDEKFLFIPIDLAETDIFVATVVDTQGVIYDVEIVIQAIFFRNRDSCGELLSGVPRGERYTAAPVQDAGESGPGEGHVANDFVDEEDYSSMPGEEEEKDNQDVVENQSAGSSKADQESDVVSWIYGILGIIGVVLVVFLIYKFNKYRKRKQSREQRRSQRRRQRRKKRKGGKRTDAAVPKVWLADPENEEVVADGKDLEAQLE